MSIFISIMSKEEPLIVTEVMMSVYFLTTTTTNPKYTLISNLSILYRPDSY